MKFLYVVLVLSIGLVVKSDDEVTDESYSESSIDSDKVIKTPELHRITEVNSF
jgi:hypothetical protein